MSCKRRKVILNGASICLTLLLTFSAFTVRPTIVPIALVDDPVPGANQYQYMDFFGPGSIAVNNWGHVVYTALVRTSQARGIGLFLFSNGRSVPIVLPGQFFDEFGGTLTVDVSQIAINNNGSVAFVAEIRHPASPSRAAVFLYRDGSLTKLVESGVPADGTNGGRFSRFGFRTLVSFVPSTISLNDKEECAFVASIDNSQIVNGIFVATPNNVNPNVLNGKLVSGTGRSLEFFHNPKLTNRGVLLFEAGSSNSSNKEGIYLASRGSVTEVVTNQSDPIQLSLQAVNDAGTAVILASKKIALRQIYLQPEALYQASNSVLNQVAVAGQSVGQHVLKLPGSAVITSDGQVYFVGAAIRPNSELYRGVFRSNAGNISVIVEGGTFSPDVSGRLYNFRTVAATEKDWIAFIANLRKEGENPYGRDGLFLLHQ